MTTSCEERSRLHRAYGAFLSDYQRSLEVLRKRTGVMPESTYRSIRKGAEEARRLSEEAKAKLDAHLAEHQCGEEPCD